MAGPGRDMQNNREPTAKSALCFPRDLENKIRDFRTRQSREIDNFSHAVRILLNKGLRGSTAVNVPMMKARMPNGTYGSRKEIIMTEDLFSGIREFKFANAKDIDSDADAIRILCMIGLDEMESKNVHQNNN